MSQEAIKFGRGQLAKGLVCLAKGIGLRGDSGDKPLEVF